MPELIWCAPCFLGAEKEWAIKSLYEIRKRGATGIRIFLNSVWPLRPGYNYASPYLIEKWQWDFDVPELGVRAGLLTPIYADRNQLASIWNEDYFSWLSEIIDVMKKLDLKLHASLFDFCSFKLPSFPQGGRTKAFQNWYQKRKLLGGGGPMNQNKFDYHALWVDKIISFLKDSEIDFDVETINEGWYLPYWAPTEDEARAEFINFHNFIVERLLKKDISIQKIYISGEENPETIDIYKEIKRGYICRHGISNPDMYNKIWFDIRGSASHKMFLSNDGGGHNPGNDGPRGIYNKVETGIHSAEWLANKILEKQHPGFEFLSHSIDFPGEDMGNGPFGYLDALEVMGQKFNSIPEKIERIICVESKKLAGAYCPVTEMRYFWPWEEIPGIICDIHLPPPPPPPPPKPGPWLERLFSWLFGKNSLFQKILKLFKLRR